jgi:uncharacterized membrane protein YeaQ/YmgE (transglycosylase-associated protein family)
MSKTFVKWVYLAGALWNLAGGAFVVFATGWIFATAGLAPPVPPAYYQAWIALFLTFGIGYFMAWRDPYGNRNIIILGIIGKLAFAAVFLYNMFAFPGQVPMFFLIPLIGDLVFVVLYWMSLRAWAKP